MSPTRKRGAETHLSLARRANKAATILRKTDYYESLDGFIASSPAIGTPIT